MIIILSQKIDSNSSYDDDVFTSYHYPARYRNQIHEGDTFVYYQGNRYHKEQRYYFGTGKIGKITILNDDSYKADLFDCHKFKNKVPIYLPDGGYFEQLGYQSVRNSINPPWQSSIRPLSEEAYNCIIEKSGIANKIHIHCSLEEEKDLLKKAIRRFFLECEDDAIIEINGLSADIAAHLGITK